jgi:hypothetical protein
LPKLFDINLLSFACKAVTSEADARVTPPRKMSRKEEIAINRFFTEIMRLA